MNYCNTFLNRDCSTNCNMQGMRCILKCGKISNKFVSILKFYSYVKSILLLYIDDSEHVVKMIQSCWYHYKALINKWECIKDCVCLCSSNILKKQESPGVGSENFRLSLPSTGRPRPQVRWFSPPLDNKSILSLNFLVIYSPRN